MIVRRRSVYADRLLDFPDLVFSDGGQFSRRGTWRDFFRDRVSASDPFDGRVIFEIGCNDAAFLAAVAARHPATAFVGIDWKCRALHTAAERIAAAGLSNVALLHGRAQDMGRIFANGELDEIWLFHPDPCDKPRELANRLFAGPFLIDTYRVLRDGGALILKTDHPDYFRSAVAAAEAIANRFEMTGASTDFWNDRSILAHAERRSFGGEATAFERRFLRKRQPIHYLELTKRPATGS